jgi:PilZ domain-containing protein
VEFGVEGHQQQISQQGGQMKPRYKRRIPLKATVNFSTGSRIGEGQILDLTCPGCLIKSPIAVQKGQSLQLKIALPDQKLALMVALGVVRWTDGKQFGVEFIKMDEPHRVALNRFMAQHLPDVAPMRTTKNTFSEPGGQNWHLKTYTF